MEKYEMSKRATITFFFRMIIVILITFITSTAHSEEINYTPWNDINQNGTVEKFEAQRYTIWLKDQLVLSRGITVWESIQDKPDSFLTEQPMGQESFRVIDNRIRLISIDAPIEFAKENEHYESNLTLLRFFTYNWPEINEVQFCDETDDSERLTYSCYSNIKIDSVLKRIIFSIGILKQTGKIFFLQTEITAIPNKPSYTQPIKLLLCLTQIQP